MATKIGPKLLTAAFGTTLIAGAIGYTKREEIVKKCDEIYKQRTGPFKPAEGETFFHGTKLKGRTPWKAGEKRVTPAGEYFIADRFKDALPYAQGTGLNYKKDRSEIGATPVDKSPGMVVELSTEAYKKKFFSGVKYLEPSTPFEVVSCTTEIPEITDEQLAQYRHEKEKIEDMLSKA